MCTHSNVLSRPVLTGDWLDHFDHESSIDLGFEMQILNLRESASQSKVTSATNVTMCSITLREIAIVAFRATFAGILAHHAFFICHDRGIGVPPMIWSRLTIEYFVQAGHLNLLDAIGNGRFRISGAIASGVTPLPMPNSTVKL